MDHPFTRREFLALSALLTAAGAGPAPAASETRASRTLERTGLDVSEVGMGVMITSDPAQVRAALEGGVTYFDTARSYMGGRNEAILAEGLASRRKEVVVATKSRALGRKGSVIASCEESLRALRTDVIDVFQLHGLSSRSQVLLPDHLEALVALRKAGKIRFAGVTTHYGMVEVMEAAVEAKVYDVVLTSFNFQVGPEVVDAARKTAVAGLGVVAMKVMTGGYAAPKAAGLNPYQSALRWVLKHPFIASTIPSMTTFEQVRENLAAMGTEHTWTDDAVLRMYALAAGGRYCRACGTCAGQCPEAADIPAALRALMYLEGYRQPELAAQAIAAAAVPCGGCSACTVRCRFGIELPGRMAAAARLAQSCHA